MAHVILHNRNTEEDFRYDLPRREAQALVDMAAGALRPLSWAVREASDDLLVPRSLSVSGGE